MSDCNPHPDAPHGFDRTASLNEDRYVCDCESWSEKYADRIPRESDLRTRIAAVQAQHHHWDYAGALTCACGEAFGLGGGWEAAVAGWAVHVADRLIRDLMEREHWQYGDGHTMGVRYRYVTEWEIDKTMLYEEDE